MSEVGKNYAKVLTILDTIIEVGAYDIRTRDIGTTSGDITLARNGQLRLNMLPKDCTVSQATSSIPPVTADCTPRILPSARSPRSIPIPAA